jgi:hypothetical protein
VRTAQALKRWWVRKGFGKRGRAVSGRRVNDNDNNWNDNDNRNNCAFFGVSSPELLSSPFLSLPNALDNCYLPQKEDEVWGIHIPTT